MGERFDKRFDNGIRFYKGGIYFASSASFFVLCTCFGCRSALTWVLAHPSAFDALAEGLARKLREIVGGLGLASLGVSCYIHVFFVHPSALEALAEGLAPELSEIGSFATTTDVRFCGLWSVEERGALLREHVLGTKGVILVIDVSPRVSTIARRLLPYYTLSAHLRTMADSASPQPLSNGLTPTLKRIRHYAPKRPGFELIRSIHFVPSPLGVSHDIMKLQSSLAAAALASLDYSERIRVEKYLAVANRGPTSPPKRRPQQLRRITSTAFAFQSQGLANVALDRLRRRDRARVENYLALVDHEPVPPPEPRPRLQSTLDPTPVKRPTARARTGSTTSLAEFLLYCFFKDNEGPSKVVVPSECVSSKFVQLAGLELDVPTGASLQLWQNGNWTTFTRDTPLPRGRGVHILFVRRKGVTLMEELMNSLSPTNAIKRISARVVFIVMRCDHCLLLRLLAIHLYCFEAYKGRNDSAPLLAPRFIPMPTTNSKWLAKGIPIPEYLKKECPKYAAHTFELRLGAQDRTSGEIGVWSCYCEVGCTRLVSRRWPEAAQQELYDILEKYKALMARQKNASQDQKASLRRELKVLEARRDSFANRDWTTSSRKRPGENDDGETERPRKKIRDDDAQDMQLVDVQTPGKGKAVDRRGEDVQYDDNFDPAHYVLDSCQSLTIEVIVYETADQAPTEELLHLRHGGGLRLADTAIAARVGAITTSADAARDYEWYCVFEDRFLPDAFTTTINMIPRGRFLICRSATILETECPGLQRWVNQAYHSLVPLAEAYSSGEEDDNREFAARVSSSQSSRPPGPSQSTLAASSQSSAVAGSSRSSQSGPSRISTAASTQRRPKVSEADAFEAMEKEDTFWDRQDEERKVLIRGFKTTAETVEVIEISDSD
ncbi:hypothetical protein B0H12DRAFT_1237907 [Mycena haematopus]|nr:hypothetical protein B0H12DRAFT_1237907 [Mycena haematopus]